MYVYIHIYADLGQATTLHNNTFVDCNQTRDRIIL